MDGGRITLGHIICGAQKTNRNSHRFWWKGEHLEKTSVASHTKLSIIF